MKFSLARPALALAITLTLASCGGGKATYPITVTVSNLLYDGLTLTTNGMDLDVHPSTPPGADVTATFPNSLEYGQVYNVIPKGGNLSSNPPVPGKQPLHQTCAPATTYPFNLPYTATAGQLAKIQVNYVCSVNAYPLGGVVKGLTGTGLLLANGSSSGTKVDPVVDSNNQPPAAGVPFSLSRVAWNQTYGVVVFAQPEGQTCSVTAGGDNGQGAGTMKDTYTDGVLTDASGVTNLVVTCVAKSN
jgi:hypothetical protein